MKIAVLGLGYVGLTAAACSIRQGHTVFGIDSNEDKVTQIAAGRSPIQEPGIEELIALGRREGRLSVCQAIDGELDACDLALVCVGTPSAPDGSHDMAHVAEVSRQIATLVGRARAVPLVVAFRSTFRPGTLDELVAPIFRSILGDAAAAVELVYYPEFLREATSIEDYFNPPRIVIGTHDGARCTLLDVLNREIKGEVFYTSYRDAEFTKFADNGFHALKVAFANELGRICTKIGVSAQRMHQIFIADQKLNISPNYLRPGGPFGGSCLPKDLRALSYISNDVGAYAPTIDSIIKSNEAHKQFLFEHATAGLAAGARILMVGLAFKADSDDLRESPSLDIARKILRAGHRLDVYDPSVEPAKLMGANLGYAYANLPSITRLLVSRQTAETTLYDRVIDTNGRASTLSVSSGSTVDINALP